MYHESLDREIDDDVRMGSTGVVVVRRVAVVVAAGRIADSIDMGWVEDTARVQVAATVRVASVASRRCRSLAIA